MTTTQTTDKKADVQSTSQPAAGNNPGKKGDYTKYFYRNIDHLWAAVEQLQNEMAKIEERRANAKNILTEVL